MPLHAPSEAVVLEVLHTPLVWGLPHQSFARQRLLLLFLKWPHYSSHEHAQVHSALALPPPSKTDSAPALHTPALQSMHREERRVYVRPKDVDARAVRTDQPLFLFFLQALLPKPYGRQFLPDHDRPCSYDDVRWFLLHPSQPEKTVLLREAHRCLPEWQLRHRALLSKV